MQAAKKPFDDISLLKEDTAKSVAAVQERLKKLETAVEENNSRLAVVTKSLEPPQTAENSYKQAMEALKAGDARGALWFAADFSEDRAAAEAHLDLICAWYRDVAALASGGAESAIANQDLAALAREAAGRHGAMEALRRIDLCSSARATLRFNASPKLQLEQAALRFVYRDA